MKLELDFDEIYQWNDDPITGYTDRAFVHKVTNGKQLGLLYAIAMLEVLDGMPEIRNWITHVRLYFKPNEYREELEPRFEITVQLPLDQRFIKDGNLVLLVLTPEVLASERLVGIRDNDYFPQIELMRSLTDLILEGLKQSLVHVGTATQLYVSNVLEQIR